MVEREKPPYGYIYRATNVVNDKVYTGQTRTDRWKEGQIPIEERWKEEVGDAYRRQSRGKELRYIENAIIKYGPDNFILIQEDIAQNQGELDAKETFWIDKHDSMNPDKGYNLKEGGRGGRLSEQAKEKLSRVRSEKWQKDLEYREKQTKERRERGKDPEWQQKMTEINQEIARNPKVQEKMSKSLSDKWQDQNYQKNVSEGVANKWQQTKFRERQLRAKTEGRREIPDRREFLKEILNMNKNDLNTKYDMDGKCINKRIEDMLGHHGVKNFSQAKKYLGDKNLDEMLKDINKFQKEHHQKPEIKKEISNKRDFLKDIQNMQSKEIAQKYDMNRSTINKRIQEMLGEHGVHNYTEAKNYLENKDLEKVLNDINERLSKQAERYQGTTDITDKKQFLQDIQTMQKNEINYKYDMDAKTINRKIREMLGEHGIRNYTEAKEYLKDKNVDGVLKDIEERDKQKEFKPESQGEGLKDKGESKSEDNSKEKTDEDAESDEKEDLKERSKEENEENKSEKNEENSERNQNRENSDENLREEGEKSAEIEENIESKSKDETEENTSKEREENNIKDSEENTSKESSNSEEGVKLGKNVEDMENLNLTVKDYAGIDKNSSERAQDIMYLDGDQDSKNSSEREQDIMCLDEKQGSKNSESTRYINLGNADIVSIEIVKDIKPDGNKDYKDIDEGGKKERPDYAHIDNFLDKTRESEVSEDDKRIERGKEYRHT